MSKQDGKLCEVCRFWVRDEQDPNVGQCHRYPKPENGKAKDYWCGQWKRIKSGAAFKETT